MPFSKQVKEDALVASGRRCCICHELKHTNMEVHHIKPQAEGGTDDFDNAIPVCFDCHANIGHYNPKHPKGVNYSQRELKKHRDTWYKIIKDGSVISEADNIQFTYYVAKSSDIVNELIKGEINNFPTHPIGIIRNNVFEFIKICSESQLLKNRDDEIFSSSYDSYEHYQKEYGGYRHFTSNRFHEFEIQRDITELEFKNDILDKDPYIKFLDDMGLPKEKLAKVRFYECICGDSFNKVYDVRPINFLFLNIQNIDNNPVFLEKIGDNPTIDLKGRILNAGESIAIPLKCFSPELDFHLSSPDTILDYSTNDLSTGQVQDVSVVDNFAAQEMSVGPTFTPNFLTFKLNGKPYKTPIRKFENKNLLLISRYWECGSCPHYLIQDTENNWRYGGELFNKPGIMINEEISFNKSDISLKIFEIEDEITEIKFIACDDRLLLKDITLLKNQSITIDIEGLETVNLIGKYDHKAGVTYVLSDDKQRKIWKFCNQNKINLIHHTFNL